MRRSIRIIAALALLAVATVGLGTFVPRPFMTAPLQAGSGARRIFILMNPIHTDIAIPLDEATRERFAFLGEAGQPVGAPGARYLVIGWGGREFYTQTPTWSELKPMPLLKGLTLDRAVMHVDVAGNIPDPYPGIEGFDLDDDAFARLVDFVDASFSRQQGAPVHLPDIAYGDYDGFYEANGRFTAVLGCNTWAAAALRSAGFRTGWWNPLPQTLGLSLRLFN